MMPRNDGHVSPSGVRALLLRDDRRGWEALSIGQKKNAAAAAAAFPEREVLGDGQRRAQAEHVEQLTGVRQVNRMFTDEDGSLALGDSCGKTASLEHIGHDKSLLHRVSLLSVSDVRDNLQNAP
jgi:hypothetical protein